MGAKEWDGEILNRHQTQSSARHCH